MSWTILNADARHIPLADKSVQCVVTSPPYWGLRDYGTARWEGGDDGCDHIAGRGGHLAESAASTRGGANKVADAQVVPFKGECGKCGATRIDSQIGLEKTPQEYVEKIVAVFREVKRVLRDDGVIFVNLGDSYASNPSKGGSGPNGKNGYGEGYGREMRKGSGRADGIVSDESPRNRDGAPPCDIPAKNLIGIPWRVAFALQADGWYLRSDIIWSKPNPMPESVTDRPTKAHEYIFLLSKNERYFWDQDAVREDSSPGTIERFGNGRADRKMGKAYCPERNESMQSELLAGRNIRTVWTIATQPYAEAHFATFPEELAERCIKAGTSEKGCCAKCGKARERVTEGTKYNPPIANEGERFVDASRGDKNRKLSGADYNNQVSRVTIGWQPGCTCDAPTVPCVVLDPFAGAGTVPLVADKLGRQGIGLELKQDYCRMAERRCYDDAPLLVGL